MATANQDIKHYTPVLCNEAKSRNFEYSSETFYLGGNELPELTWDDYEPPSNWVSAKIGEQIMELTSSFKLQFLKLSSYFPDLDFATANERMMMSLYQIMNLDPTSISLELIPDGNVFYTIKKNSYTIYYHHFIVDIIDDSEDEVVLTIYKGERKLPSFAGSLEDSHSVLRKIF